MVSFSILTGRSDRCSRMTWSPRRRRRDAAPPRRRPEDHTRVHASRAGPCISRKTKEITSPPACGPGQEAVSRLQRFGRMCISKQRRIAKFWHHLSGTARRCAREVLADAAERRIRDSRPIGRSARLGTSARKGGCDSPRGTRSACGGPAKELMRSTTRTRGRGVLVSISDEVGGFFSAEEAIRTPRIASECGSKSRKETTHSHHSRSRRASTASRPCLSSTQVKVMKHAQEIFARADGEVEHASAGAPFVVEEGESIVQVGATEQYEIKFTESDGPSLPVVFKRHSCRS